LGERKKSGIKLESLDDFAYNRVIKLYRDNGMWRKAMEVLMEMDEMGIPPDKRVYNRLLIL
jgi:pentatricopeptide repeat protein